MSNNRRAICKSCGQDFDLFEVHNCPSLTMTKTPSPATPAFDSDSCPPHCCCCGPGEPCCDCGEIVPNMIPERPVIWTEQQVAGLNEFQHSRAMHPFTCGNNHDGDRELVATRRGWICPCCDYTQDWAHSFMMDGSAIAASQGMLAALASPSPDVAAAVPEGWALVPKEPTPEMVGAGYDAWMQCDDGMEDFATIYRAMLSAAPTPDPVAVMPAEGEVERLAHVIDRARYWPGEEHRIRPFEEQDERGKEYCRRIARAVLAARPVQEDGPVTSGEDEVTQADREAALELWRPFGDATGYYFSCRDDGLIVQAFACHRRAALASNPIGSGSGWKEAAAKVADDRAHYCAQTMELPGLRHDDRMVWEQRRNEARGIARAIRALTADNQASGDVDALTGCADDQTWANVPVDSLRAAADDLSTGPTHERG